jgi:hypothetical protein
MVGLKAWSRTIDSAMIWINLFIVISIWVGVFVLSVRLLGVTMVVNLCLFHCIEADEGLGGSMDKHVVAFLYSLRCKTQKSF